MRFLALCVMAACMTAGVAGCAGSAPPVARKPAANAVATRATDTPASADASARPASPSATATSAPADTMHPVSAASAQGKAIVAALKPAVAEELGQPVAIKVERIAGHDSFAFLSGRPTRPDGKAIDYSQTVYADDLGGGAFDDGVHALLQRKNGSWEVAAYVIGATDVAWSTWPQEYGAPRDIFGF